MSDQLNTFHWHVVDSQSFPLSVPNYTELADKGAYSADAVYTPDDVAEIVSYAGAVRPIPSVSCPHTSHSDLHRMTISVGSMFSSYVTSLIGKSEKDKA
jgi:N-acetyl-beta-hexosaminidase